MLHEVIVNKIADDEYVLIMPDGIAHGNRVGVVTALLELGLPLKEIDSKLDELDKVVNPNPVRKVDSCRPHAQFYRHSVSRVLTN